MSYATDRVIADVTGPTAMPRKNGELVFGAPWESRAFGMVVALADEVFEWAEFRAELISEIARWEAADDAGEWSYYERWLSTLEAMLIRRGLISRVRLRARIVEVGDTQAHEHVHLHSGRKS